MLRLLIVFTLFSLPCSAAIDFAHQIAPLLKKHCAECHLGEKKKGSFSMNTRAALLAGSENGAVLAVGKANASRFIEVLRSTDSDEQMPPKGARLSAAEISLLTQWIDEGLAWEEGFTFGKNGYEPPLKPRVVQLPAPSQPGREHGIDRIIDRYLADKGLPTPKPADEATLRRRLAMDLIGYLPSDLPENITAEQLLKRDLDYTEHWLTMWNDLLRNDYKGTGYIDGGRKQITNWLYQSLFTNKPFDQFTRELLSPTGDSEGFINGIKWRGNVNASQVREVQFAQSISQVFLGINMKCASCHDSFIDRWKLEDAYSLAAIYADAPIEMNRCDKPTGRMATAAWIFPELGQVDAKAAKPERLKQLAALMTHRENGRFTRTTVNRLWHRLMGRGIVHPVDAMHTEPWSADLLDHLAEKFVELRYDVKAMLAYIASSQAYRSVSVTSNEESTPEAFVYKGPIARRLTAEQFVDAVWQLTGAGAKKPDGSVLRGGGDESAKPQAQWIWSQTGARPAGEVISLRKTFSLIDEPTSAKITLSVDNSYRLFVNGKLVLEDDDIRTAESAGIGSHLRKGANNVVIVATNGGKTPNRAGAWAQIDLISAEGKPQTIGTDATWEWTSQQPNARGQFEPAPKDWKRAVLQAPDTWNGFMAAITRALSMGGGSAAPVRASLVVSDAMQRALGRPNREQIVTVRPENITTLEAIDLANGAMLSGWLKQGAAGLLATKDQLVPQVYHRLLGRAAQPEEASALASILGDKPTTEQIEDLLWSVLLLPEFQFVR